MSKNDRIANALRVAKGVNESATPSAPVRGEPKQNEPEPLFDYSRLSGIPKVPQTTDYDRALELQEATRPKRADGGPLLNQQGMYSQAAQSAAALPQAKGTMPQMLASMKGVKPAEIQNSGLDPKSPTMVQRDNLSRYFQQALPKVHETTYSDNDIEENDDGERTGAPQYEDYTIPSGRNYRELLLHAPKNQPDPAKLRALGDKARLAWQASQRYRAENGDEAVTGVPLAHDPEYMRLRAEERAADKAHLDARKPDPKADFHSSHWDGVPNVLAHLRLSERRSSARGPAPEDDQKIFDETLPHSPERIARLAAQAQAEDAHKHGESLLHLEELQSDWGQAAREHGFRDPKFNPDAAEREIQALQQKGVAGSATEDDKKRWADLMNQKQQQAKGVPHHPHVASTNAWTDFGLKRALLEAAKDGHHRLAWTPGQQQADRYGLQKKFRSLAYHPADGILEAHSWDKGHIAEQASPERLQQYIGKELADRLLAATKDAQGRHYVEGDDLRTGGEGMKGFYDKLLPTRLKEIVKKLGHEAQFEPVKITHKPIDPKLPPDAPGNMHTNLHSLKITPELRQSILKGMPAFQRGGDVERKAPEGYTDGGAVALGMQEPKQTVKAYKLFNTKDGRLFPLYVHADKEVPVGQWLSAEAGLPGKTDGKVKSKLGDLAYRPGWHSGDLPVATHIGGVSTGEKGGKPDYRPDHQVWAEVEHPADVDWQSEANKRARIMASGKPELRTAHITDQVPHGGYYRYKTNSNMPGNWLISGGMKVNRVLHDNEVKAINDRAGVADLPRKHELEPDVVQKALRITARPAKQRAYGGQVDPDEKPKGFTAYHGSPHSFDKFDMSKIGTGEGAQAYGHGLYFAGNEGVAKSYRDALAKDQYYTPKGDMFDPQSQLKHLNVRVAARGNGPDIDATMARARELLSKASEQTRPMLEHDLSVLQSIKDAGGVSKNPGHMYEVHVPHDPEHFLDWDKPLSEQHPKVRGAVRTLASHKNAYLGSSSRKKMLSGDEQGAMKGMDSGAGVFANLEGYAAPAEGETRPSFAARVLKEAGIPGIRYLDGGSRGAGAGSHNYVLFDDKDPKIVRKYERGGDVGDEHVQKALRITARPAKQFAEGGSVSFQERLAQSRREMDAAHDIVKAAIAHERPSLILEKGARKHVLSAGLEGTPYRITSWDEDGPSGHRDYGYGDTRQMASEVSSALRNGFTVREAKSIAANRSNPLGNFNPGVVNQAQAMNDTERMAKEHGYSGVANPRAAYPMAAMFDRVPVKHDSST